MHRLVFRQSLGQRDAGLASTQHNATCDQRVSVRSNQVSKPSYRFRRQYLRLLSGSGDYPFSLVWAAALGIVIWLAREWPRGEQDPRALDDARRAPRAAKTDRRCPARMRAEADRSGN